MLCLRRRGRWHAAILQLLGLRLRRDRSWVMAHFADPDKLSPGSGMPPYSDLSPADLESLTSYVMSIPKTN